MKMAKKTSTNIMKTKSKEAKTPWKSYYKTNDSQVFFEIVYDEQNEIGKSNRQLTCTLPSNNYTTCETINNAQASPISTILLHYLTLKHT